MPHSVSFSSSDLEIEAKRPTELANKPEVKDLQFGKTYTDHMLKIKWTAADGWGTPKISPLEPFQMHPGAKVRRFDKLTDSIAVLNIFQISDKYFLCNENNLSNRGSTK